MKTMLVILLSLNILFMENLYFFVLKTQFNCGIYNFIYLIVDKNILLLNRTIINE